MITGNMNILKDNYIKSSYSLKQIVSKPTHGTRILDKVYTNLTSLYKTPVIILNIGKSDHNGVLCHPASDYNELSTVPVKQKVRTSGHNEKVLFASALLDTDWTTLYRMQTCYEQFEFFMQNVTDLLDTFLPMKEMSRLPSDKLLQKPDSQMLAGAFQRIYATLQNALK